MEQSYKEKYEKALERIKNLIDKDHNDINVDDILNVFPELAESEDEKVRKEIINYFQCQSEEEPTRKEIHNKWIAWLEKQVTSYTKMDVDDAYLKGVRDTKNEIEKQYEANYQTRKDIATFIFNYKGDIKDRAKWMDYLGIKVSFVGEQGKQKPEENKGNIREISSNWSEEDSQYVKDTLALIGFGFSAHTIGEVQEWLHSLQDRVQPKQKWSEEDEENMKKILDAIGSYYYLTTDDDILYNWLKSIKDRVQPKQEWTEEEIEPIISDYLCGREHYGGMIGRLCHLKPKQKQTEWGEDDEAFLDDILCKLEHDLILNKNEKDWLKSLRPQNKWKPSDEQMEALDWQVENTSVGSWQYKATKELIADLKKLKEG